METIKTGRIKNEPRQGPFHSGSFILVLVVLVIVGARSPLRPPPLVL